MEAYILTRSMHFGYLKESFGRGAVIQFDPENRQVTIDGRHFEDSRDVEILKRQAAKNPHKPWLVACSPEALAEIRGESGETAPAVPKHAPNNDGLPVVQSDEDMHEDIDIRHTKVAAINAAKKDAQHQKAKDGDLEIIRGDESVEDRIARLKEAKDSDLAARAERVRLMSLRKAEMPVVHDDSLGHAGGSKSSSLNVGQPVGGRRAEETPERVQQAAEKRKQEAVMRRREALESAGLDPDSDIEVVPVPPESVEEELAGGVLSEAVEVDPKDAEIARLKEQLAVLQAASAGNFKVRKTSVKKTPVERR